MNALATTSALLVLARVRSAVDWSIFGWLAPAALVAVPVDAFFASRRHEAVLFVVIGSISVAVIAGSFVVWCLGPTCRDPPRWPSLGARRA
ncbi:hypothetical protein [Pseudonocardia sp. N23]|uniref:hypothetical protein n=1 Tax=Pseudonocardia sp. N23 TaxID=1987376 RepID=UPI000C02B228|nr:hypothetical protein [Pseudonocardia sp. N23]RTL65361.1 MAG: hypothetical protein EKK42_21440 [Pseudonocardiaceae bacterium]GAY10658.1 hypothetical protein TOK_5019 [Pseudonocardia sp. N23]